MKSDDSARSGRTARRRSTRPQEEIAAVPAVHRLEDAVGARLHRQVQVRHELRHLAMGGDQIVVHVARMGGGVADARQALDLGQRPDQPRQRPGRPPVRARLAVIGVDVLAEQRDLDRARRHQLARLGQHRRSRPRIFGAARIGHDAEGAELVAAFLDRQERRAGAHAVAAPAGGRTCSRPGNRCRARRRPAGACRRAGSRPCARPRPAARAGGDRPAGRRRCRRRAGGARSPRPRPGRRSRRRRW